VTDTLDLHGPIPDDVMRKTPGGIEPIEQWFWSQVEVRSEQECWLWAAAGSRYGHLTYTTLDGRRRTVSAHRMAWRLTFGSWPGELYVCHTCDVPRCVNPSHLFLGTNSENQQDMLRKGRGNYWGGPFRGVEACVAGHPFTPENTYNRPSGGRDCRTCRESRWRRSRAKRRAITHLLVHEPPEVAR
jgi:hypothetical protein